jgi:hypothetical protein
VAPLAKPPAVTSKVDDVVSAILTDSSDEISQIAKATDDDITLAGLDSDSEAISDFGQPYNENDF